MLCLLSPLLGLVIGAEARFALDAGLTGPLVDLLVPVLSELACFNVRKAILVHLEGAQLCYVVEGPMYQHRDQESQQFSA